MTDAGTVAIVVPAGVAIAALAILAAYVRKRNGQRNGQ